MLVSGDTKFFADFHQSYVTCPSRWHHYECMFSRSLTSLLKPSPPRCACQSYHTLVKEAVAARSLSRHCLPLAD